MTSAPQRWYGALCLLAWLGPGGVHAQVADTLRIADGLSVSSCPAVLDPVGLLALPDTMPALSRGDLGRIALASDGRVWIAPSADPTTIVGIGLAHGEPDRYVRHRVVVDSIDDRIFGIAIGPGDTLHVLGAGSLSRYAPSGRLVSQRALPMVGIPGEIGILEDGTYVLSGELAGTGRPAPVHVFAGDDTLRRSIGGDQPEFEVGTFAARRAIAPDSEGRFWSAPRSRFALTLWDSTGVVQRRVVWEPGWFDPWTVWTPPTSGPPPPRLWSLSKDEAGRLWIMTYVAAADFTVLEPPEDRGPMGRRHPSYDTVINVVDLDSNTVTAHCRFGALLSGFLNGLHVAEPDVDEDGRQVFRLLRLAWTGR